MINLTEGPRIAFIGAVDFSNHCLLEAIKHQSNIVAVIGLDPKRASRHSDYVDLSHTAINYDIPYHSVNNINSNSSVKKLKELNADYFFIFGWSQLLSTEVLSIPKIGSIGSHPALLPKNRGRHPLIWSLINNEETGGLTFLYLDKGIDDGDILWQESFPITEWDDSGTLYTKIKTLASKAIPDLLDKMTVGPLIGTRQATEMATYLRKRSEADGLIHWSLPAKVIHNLVRALTHPYVGAHSYYNERKITIWKSQIQNAEDIPAQYQRSIPGLIFEPVKDVFCVTTGSVPLQLLEYDVDDNNTLSSGSYMET
ncbi:MAG: formyl transferase [Dehalococcoidia bacterium]|nr:formyl transferase [Dehalococcoidia bacterium]|tara:strand:+ start:4907 stop:5842 length:936 start_codon:yes stop_codon:yes gene_type:complete